MLSLVKTSDAVVRKPHYIDTFFFVSTIHKKYSIFFVGNIFSLDGHLSVVRDDS